MTEHKGNLKTIRDADDFDFDRLIGRKANNLQSLRVILTGASRGIGRAIAVRLAIAGCDLALFARDAEALEETVDLCRAASHVYSFKKTNISTFICDVTDTEHLTECFAAAVDNLGGLDVLINNAGLALRTDMGDALPEQIDSIVDVNLRSVMHLCRQAVPILRKSGGATRAVINISSIAGQQAYSGGGLYCATKWGLQGFTHALFKDVREDGVKVSSICPGYTNTAINWNKDRDLSKMLQPEDVAEAVIWVLQYPNNGCPREIVIEAQKDPR
jgi:NADP-dependent 3-hydroxy acid dehydrogenase YdfG